jgi:hypothetical protein
VAVEHFNLQKARLVCTVAALALAGCGGDYNGDFSSNFVGGYDSFAIATGDFDNNGRPDVAITSTLINHFAPHAGNVNVYLHGTASAAAFDAYQSYAAGNDPVAIVAADLNNDGLTDLVVIGEPRGGINGVSILLNDPAHPGSFLPAQFIALANYPESLVVADVDGDSRPDIVVGGGGSVALLLQNSTASGSFLAPTYLATGYGSGQVAVGDVNHDDVPDIVTAGSGGVQAYLQSPSQRGSFGAAVTLLATPASAFVLIADLDGDGYNDIVTGGPCGATGIASSIQVMTQNPASAGQFSAAVTYATLPWVGSAVIADMNNDTRLDIVVGTANGVSLLMQNPTAPGQFLPATNISPTFVASNGLTYYDDFFTVAVADLNLDGAPDIVTPYGPSSMIVNGYSYSDPGVLYQDPANPGSFLSFQSLR